MQISLEEKISSAIVEAVRENAADVGVCNRPEGMHGLEVLPYRCDEFVVAAPREHALAQHAAARFTDALDFDFIGLHTGSSINLLLTRAAAEAQRILRLRIQVTSWDGLCRMVEAGLGIAVLPRIAAEPYVESGRICVLALAEPWARRELSLCVRALDALPRAARLLVEHLKAPGGRA